MATPPDPEITPDPEGTPPPRSDSDAAMQQVAAGQNAAVSERLRDLSERYAEVWRLLDDLGLLISKASHHRDG